MSKSELVVIRDYIPEEDKNFIMATFLRGLYYGESLFSEVKKSVFMENYHKVGEYLLTSPKHKVKVACFKDDPSTILGYALLSADESTVHFVFCKKAWRSIGIMRMLVPKSVTTTTHLTKVGLSLIKKYNLEFNPFVL